MGQAAHASITGPVTTAIRIMEADHDPRRRLVLSALAAAPFVARPAFGREAHPDADLLALKARWDALDVAQIEGFRISEELHEATTLPDRPAALSVRPEDRDLGIERYAKTRGELDRWYLVESVTSETQSLRRRFWRDVSRVATEADPVPAGDEIWSRAPWPEAQARADEIVAASDAWLADRARAFEMSGYTAASERVSEILREQGAVERELQAATPRTMAGLAALAAFALRYQEDGDDDGLLGGMLARAILAVAGRSPASGA
jgi:hypothetical protein